MQSIRPIGNRLVVKPDVNAPQSSVIAILEISAQQPQTGVVTEISSNLQTELIKVSDRVLFTKNAGHETLIDNVKHRVLNLDDVLAVIS